MLCMQHIPSAGTLSSALQVAQTASNGRQQSQQLQLVIHCRGNSSHLTTLPCLQLGLERGIFKLQGGHVSHSVGYLHMSHRRRWSQFRQRAEGSTQGVSNGQ